MAFASIYLVLHGETKFNVAKRAQGRCDSPLTDRGRREGEAIGMRLRQMGIEARRFMSSPLGRCCATAAIIADCIDFPTGRIANDPRLDEVSLGVWEGLTNDEITAGWPMEMKGTNAFDWYFRAPGGERIEDVQYRMRGWLADQAADDGLIIVGHGISSRVLRGLCADLPMDQALQLDVDRDAIFVLEGKTITKVRAG